MEWYVHVAEGCGLLPNSAGKLTEQEDNGISEGHYAVLDTVEVGMLKIDTKKVTLIHGM